MDEDRLNHVCAEAQALRIIIGAILEIFPDQILLRQTIKKHAQAIGSMLPSETEEQKQHIALIRKKLNTFSWVIEEPRQ